MTKKITTIEDLAIMVGGGFDGVKKDFDGLRTEMKSGFHNVNERLDRIENALFGEYRDRVERLEGEVKELQADFRQLVSGKKK